MFSPVLMLNINMALSSLSSLLFSSYCASFCVSIILATFSIVPKVSSLAFHFNVIWYVLSSPGFSMSDSIVTSPSSDTFHWGLSTIWNPFGILSCTMQLPSISPVFFIVISYNNFNSVFFISFELISIFASSLKFLIFSPFRVMFESFLFKVKLNVNFS